MGLLQLNPAQTNRGTGIKISSLFVQKPHRWLLDLASEDPIAVNFLDQ